MRYVYASVLLILGVGLLVDVAQFDAPGSLAVLGVALLVSSGIEARS